MSMMYSGYLCMVVWLDMYSRVQFSYLLKKLKAKWNKDSKIEIFIDVEICTSLSSVITSSNAEEWQSQRRRKKRNHPRIIT